MRNEPLDYYEILEVHPKASQEIIRKAYLTLSKKYHPDTTSLDKTFAAKKMKLINEAYNTLSDKDLRTRYDLSYSLKNQPNANEKRSDDYTTDDKIKLALFACSEINSLCQSIRKEPGYQRLNSQACAKAYNHWGNYVLPAITSLRRNDMGPGFYSMVMERNSTFFNECALTLWILAGAYTWADEFSQAKSLLTESLNYVYRNDELYSKIMTAMDNVNKSLNTINKAQTNNQETQKPSVSGGKFWAVAVVIIGFFLWVAIPSTPNKGSVSTAPKASQPSAQTSKQSQQPAVQLPNPKLGVKTQYVQGDPYSNNGGLCQITIDNTRNDFPVMVRIWSTSGQPRPVRSFTIRQSEQFTAESLNPGAYEVRYVHLYEIGASKEAYKSEPMNLMERNTSDGTEYSAMRLTLYKVAHGNTHTYNIPLSDL